MVVELETRTYTAHYFTSGCHLQLNTIVQKKVRQYNTNVINDACPKDDTDHRHTIKH